MTSKLDLKADLENLFRGFQWTIRGFVDEDGKIHDLPNIPQVITGIFQEVAKQRLKPFLREHYGCEIIQGGPREYPEITAFGGKLGQGKVAIDIKTSRRIPRTE